MNIIFYNSATGARILSQAAPAFWPASAQVLPFAVTVTPPHSRETVHVNGFSKLDGIFVLGVVNEQKITNVDKKIAS